MRRLLLFNSATYQVDILFGKAVWRVHRLKNLGGTHCEIDRSRLIALEDISSSYLVATR